MKKQQLAKKLWDSANKMRGSRIEASEYKDYVLGFIFYKFLSDQEETFLRKLQMPDDVIRSTLHEETHDLVQYLQTNLGYFIAYENLFSTWIREGADFSVGHVQTALSAFSRLIGKAHEKVFRGVFNTLESGLGNLGQNTSEQTRNIRDLLSLLNIVPTDGRQGYDVLGYIYEYLVGNFAANAGKKAGEFYTPHEVSQLMSDIIAHYLQGREHIEIYDPTSGSGSLLINIGKSAARYMKNPDGIKYYAQEVKPNTFNLTRMNLIMRGIKPDNIEARCGDTLEADWPFFDEADPVHTYHPLYVDAVVSNPPYSLQWNPQNKETEPRFQYGLAPKSKADYAFLLHNLYHLRSDGIVAIVLPHGVLFRGDPDGEGEGMIRKNLIEHNQIEAIIGLPANIFFGTGIPTIIMILRKTRPDTDVLFIDASQGFIKDGKQNRLLASHIRRIVDAVIARGDIPHFARRVTKEEIRANGYNLNIPRYVDSAEEADTWDIYATICGGIPNEEIDRLHTYWEKFPRLRDTLFRRDATPYSQPGVDDVRSAIRESEEMQGFLRRYGENFAGLDDFLRKELVDGLMTLPLTKEEEILWQNIRGRLQDFTLIDPYQAYQLLDDAWTDISSDVEALQTEGWDAVRAIDPHMVTKKKNSAEVEVQEGWEGHILPFDLVQEVLLPDDLAEVRRLAESMDRISETYAEIIDSLSEEEKEGDYLNDSDTAFKAKETKEAVKSLCTDITSPEIEGLAGYIALLGQKPSKQEKLNYIAAHREVAWDEVEGAAPYAKGKAQARMQALKAAWTFPEDSLEAKLLRVLALMDEEKAAKKAYKEKYAALQQKTMKVIRTVDDDTARDLLQRKWILPLAANLRALPDAVQETLTEKAEALAEKYRRTAKAIHVDLDDAADRLGTMMDDLTGNEFDEKGLAEWKSLLKED